MKQIFKYILGTFIGVICGLFASFFLLALILGSMFASATKGEGSPGSGIKDNSILVLDLSKEMKEKSADNFFGSSVEYSLHEFSEAINKALEDKKVKAVFIKMSGSVPMGWATAKEVRQLLEKFKTSDKKIVAYGEFVDEKSLYISSVANKIVMHPTGEIRWDGFAATPTFYKGTFEKLNIKPVVFRAGKFKSAVEPFTRKSMSNESKQQLEELLEDLWEETVEGFADAREIDAKEIRDLADTAEIRTAKQALNANFIDELSLYSDVVEGLLKSTLKDDKKKKDEPEALAKEIESVEEVEVADEDLEADDSKSEQENENLNKEASMAKKEEKESLKQEDFKRFVSIPGYLSLGGPSILTSLGSGGMFENEKKKGDKIAVVIVEGGITSGRSDDGSVGSESVLRHLRKARFDENVKGVILRVNSPGGSALASDVIWYEVKKLNKVKPVFTSMGDVAASGGYYIAAGADKIYAEENTITGSIGVFSLTFNLKDMANSKLGLSFDRVVTNPYADLGSAVRSMSEEEKALFQSDVMRIYSNFLNVVQQGRRFENQSDVEALAQGRVWSGSQAKEVGLVDEIGGIEKTANDLAAKLELEDYDLVFYPKRKTLDVVLNQLFEVSMKFKMLVSDPVNYIYQKQEELKKEGVLLYSPHALKIF